MPSALTVQAVRIARRTTGIGGTPVPGGGQSYVAQTSSGALETASVEDASNVALDGVLERDPATGTYVRFGVQCTKSAAQRCAAPGSDAVGIEVGTIAIRVGDDEAPHGAVGGVSSPAVGTLDMSVFATDGGLGLASAQATLDGTQMASADIGGASCAELSPQDTTIDLPATAGCPATASGVELKVDTTSVSDGPHQLRVVVRDAAGNAATIADEQITVRNASSRGTNTATLSIGTNVTPVTPPPPPPPPPASPLGLGQTASPGPACAKPRLSVMLSSRPLHTTRGVPVLLANHAYRFTGRLTCIISGRRVSAPRGTVVEILSVIGKKIRDDGGVTVRTKGAMSVLLAYPTRRIIRFRHRSADGSVARVSIRIAVFAKPRATT